MCEFEAGEDCVRIETPGAGGWELEYDDPKRYMMLEVESECFCAPLTQVMMSGVSCAAHFFIFFCFVVAAVVG